MLSINKIKLGNLKKLVLITGVIIALVLAGWYRYDIYQRTKIAEQKAQSEKIIRALRQAGKETAARMKNNPGLPLDPLSPDEVLSDQAELTQAKLWQKMSPEQRELLRKEYSNTGDLPN